MKWFYAYLILGVMTWGVVAEEPWSVQSSSPCFERGDRVLQPGMTMRHAVPEGFVRTGCYIWLKIYQRGFRRMSSSKCPMMPSCSNYSLEAISKYGGFWGVLMTVDRLFHEGSVRHTAPLLLDEDRTRYFDPVDDNVIWRKVP